MTGGKLLSFGMACPPPIGARLNTPIRRAEMIKFSDTETPITITGCIVINQTDGQIFATVQDSGDYLVNGDLQSLEAGDRVRLRDYAAIEHAE